MALLDGEEIAATRSFKLKCQEDGVVSSHDKEKYILDTDKVHWATQATVNFFKDLRNLGVTDEELEVGWFKKGTTYQYTTGYPTITVAIFDDDAKVSGNAGWWLTQAKSLRTIYTNDTYTQVDPDPFKKKVEKPADTICVPIQEVGRPPKLSFSST
jgi:hypothetical protein